MVEKTTMNGQIMARQKTASTGEAAVKADTTLFDHGILKNLNRARAYFVEYAREHFPQVVRNQETGKEIGISRTGIDKFLSGRIGAEKYASGFHIPELIERAHKVAQAENKHTEQADSIPTYEYYDSPIQIEGTEYVAHIRVRNTMMGDKYYGHTVSEVDNIEIEPSARTSVPGESPAVRLVNAIDDSNNSIPQTVAGVKAQRLAHEAVVLADHPPAQRMGSSGRTGLVNALETRRKLGSFSQELTPEGLVEGYMDLYLAGLNGVELERGGVPLMAGVNAEKLSPTERMQAYSNGVNDAQARVEQDRRKAKFAKVAGTEAGLVYDDYVEQALDRETADQINAVAKRLGRRVSFVDSLAGGMANGQIVEGEIRIAKDSDQPIMVVFGHEVGHDLKEKAPEAYQALRRFTAQHQQEAIKYRMEEYQKAELERDYDEILMEFVNDDIGRMIADTEVLNAFIQENKSDRNLLQRFADALRALWQKLTGQEREQVKTAEAALLAALREGEAQTAKLEQAGQVAELGEEMDGLQGEHAIKHLPDGRSYVKADRQVVFGDDPQSWGEQLENYINGKIRQGEDVDLIAEDGDVLRLTADTAGKISSPYRGDGTTLSDEEYERKVSAGAHIDELVQVSKRGKKTVPDQDGRHGDFAKGGWNYRTAYFQDFDGQYYRLQISVAQGADGHIVYNIGDMRQRNFPTNSGSSAKGGALGGEKVSPKGSVPQQAPEVKGDFMLKEGESIKEQLRAHQDELRQMEPVAMVESRGLEGLSKGQLRKRITDELRPTGFQVDNKELGTIIFDEKRLNTSLDYLRSDAEAAAYMALPRVLKRGTIIARHENHKGRNYGTVTIAAPVVLNGRRGNMAVVVKQTGKNFYKMHRILMPDGTMFVLPDKTIDAKPTTGGGVTENGSLATPISSASGDIVPQDGGEVKGDFSLKGAERAEELSREITRIIREGEARGESQESIQGAIREAVTAAYQTMGEKYGTIPAGENPVREARVPRRTSPNKNERVSQTVRTILESGVTPDVMVPTIEELTARGEFSYERYGDKEAVKKAEETLERRGWDETLEKWLKAMGRGEASKDNTAMGWTLYNSAANAGNVQTAVKILDQMVKSQRNAAQAVQATRILKTMTPSGQLYQVQRSVEGLQEDIDKRYGKKGVRLVINEELAKKFMDAKDQETRDEIAKRIYRDVGRQMPSTFMDKWTAWRYLAMLGNPRTHGRNVIGNLAFAPVVGIKSAVATGLEAGVSKLSGGRLQRTKGIVNFTTEADRAIFQAASRDFDRVWETVQTGGKYQEEISANKYINEGRRIFQSELTRPLEALRRANGKALDIEDAWFAKPHYAVALTGYCKVNGITAEELLEATGGLQEDGARGTMVKREYFSKEGMTDGRQAQARDARVRESPGEGNQIHRSVKAVYTYRRVQSVQGLALSERFRAWGIESDVVDGYVLSEENGVTTRRDVQVALTAPDGMVLTIEELTARGEFSYERYGDKAAMKKAEETLERRG